GGEQLPHRRLHPRVVERLRRHPGRLGLGERVLLVGRGVAAVVLGHWVTVLTRPGTERCSVPPAAPPDHSALPGAGGPRRSRSATGRAAARDPRPARARTAGGWP